MDQFTTNLHSKPDPILTLLKLEQKSFFLFYIIWSDIRKKINISSHRAYCTTAPRKLNKIVDINMKNKICAWNLKFPKKKILLNPARSHLT